MRLTPGLLAAAVFAVGCGDAPERTEITVTDLKQDLQTLAGARVYFGHQSVGGNVLDGLKALAADEQVPLRVVPVDAAGGPGPAIVHAVVGRNREPQTKCDVFSRFLAQDTAQWDAAVLKFCYVDVAEGGDANRLLESYKSTVAAVRAARPDLTMVHATIPLQSEGTGKRDRISKAFGFGTSNDPSNVVRNEFNDRLRAEFGREPLFDVAWAESTLPDGTRVGFRHGDRFIYTMAPEYTYDEGHLTDSGKRWVAREFARAVAAALRERTKVRETTEAP